MPRILAAEAIMQFLYLFLEYCTVCLHWLCACVCSLAADDEKWLQYLMHSFYLYLLRRL